MLVILLVSFTEMDYQNSKIKNKIPSKTIFELVLSYSVPLLALIVTIGVLFFQLIPSLNRYFEIREENISLQAKNSNLRLLLNNTDNFYKVNSERINLSLELLNKIAPIESGRVTIGEQDIDALVKKNSVSLTSYKYSENLRDVVSDSLAQSISEDNLKLRVAVSESVINGTYNGMMNFLSNVYKSGKLYVIETASIRNNSNETSSDFWTGRFVISRYWYAEDFMKNKSKEELIKKAANEILTILIEKIQRKI